MRSLFLIALLALNACSYAPSRPSAGQQTQARPADHQAQTLLQRGDYLGAAQIYLSLAASGTTHLAKREDYQMTAVELLLRANLVDEAKRQMGALQNTADPGIRLRMLLAQAETDVAEGRPQDAEARLASLQNTPIPTPLHVRYYSIQALALEARQQYEQAARLRALQVDPLLRAGSEREANHQAVWRDLQQLPLEQLNQPAAGATDIWGGWLALALLLKTTQPQYQQQAVQSWQQRFPQHPAAQTFAGGGTVPRLTVSDGGAPASAYPQQPGYQGFKPHIALLLPLSGTLKRHAESVRDGFMAAWYADGQRGAVRVYDSAAGDVAVLYRQAIQNGAAAVVGPLDKNNVPRLLQALGGQPAPVPTLTLNTLDAAVLNSTAMPPNFYQFSLSPEDEAIDVALWAWQEGRRTAAILAPENEWGQRMTNAFSSQWQALGGQVVDARSYHNDFAPPVKGILSHKSYLDMVFIAAYPVEGRRIKPQFRFYLAGSLPLYATSHIYSGTPDAAQDRDIDGVRFVEIPWRINSMPANQNASAGDLYPSLSSQWPERYANRLLAFGIDAYQLAQRMPLQTSGYPVHDGETGQLSVDRQGTVHRRLQHAVFSNGLPKALDDALAPAPAPAEALPSADYGQR